MIEGIHHIAILASDREKALQFYRNALGFRIVSEHERPDRNDTIIILHGYGITLELFIAGHHPARVTDPEAYGFRHLALKVSEPDAIIDKLKAHGFTPEPVRKDFYTGEHVTFVKDPDGLPIELHE